VADTEQDLVAKLDAARAHLDDVARGGLSAHAEWRAARAHVLDLERRVAALRGEERAAPLENVPGWEAGAPEPHLLVGRGRALIACHAASAGSVLVIELTGVRAARTTRVDEAALANHALAGRGLEAATAQVVEGSRWARDLGGRHFAFWFHDEAIEAIADGISARTVEGSMDEILAQIARLVCRADR
jgi:hypothetical protein